MSQSGLGLTVSGGDIRYVDACGFSRHSLLARSQLGMVCTFLPATRLQLVPSCARICVGLPGLIACLWRAVMSCPCQKSNSDPSLISGWAAIFCQLNMAGLSGLMCQGSCASALCVLPVLRVMSVIMSLSIHILLASGRMTHMQSCFRMHLVPCKSLV